jgi:hypothetical protein
MNGMNRTVTYADGKTAACGVERSSAVTTATVANLNGRAASAR